MTKSLTFWAFVAGVAVVLMASSLFIVRQTEQVLVVQFGEIVRVIKEPGLKVKMPFVQNITRFDRRLLDFEAPPAEFITRNRDIDVEERVVIDAFVRYRITDPVQFYQAVQNEANLRSRLASIVTSGMRRTLANYSLSDLLSDKRQKIMQQIQTQVNRQAMSGKIEGLDGAADQITQGFGIEVVDVRIMRADLPADISLSTYERMRKDFTKEAQRFRAEGEERAIEVRSAAELERTELIAEARRKAETLRGEGDGEAAKIYAASFGRDPEFYGFYRSMQAYRKTLEKGDTTMIMSPKSEFLRELNP